MSSSASGDAASDLSSHDGSVLSEDVLPSPRERRTSSVHTVAAQAIVGRRRTTPSLPPPPPSARSVRYAPLSPTASMRVRPQSSSRRPPSSSAVRPPPVAEAAAIAGVAPPGADRLKHLQLHMEQLQQLYAQEIHKEELAAREAFVQSMCTSSITLWRYVSSRSRFYTAVKALVSQYLPASNAKLYQVEAHGSGESTALSLVLSDGRVVPVSVDTADAMGIAGHAAMAASQVSPSQWKKLQKMATAAQDQLQEDDDIASEGSGSLSSIASPSSSVASSVDDASTHLWLDCHADCVMPSTNDHLVLLLSLDRVYRNAGFHAEIDLTIKKRELLGSSGAQLLVIVLRDSQRRPLGVVEALVSAKKPLKIDFLDAFSSLLAAALEARQSICRPVAAADGGIRIELVHGSDDKPTEQNASVMQMEISPGTKMVVKGTGPHSINPENDLPLLQATKDAITLLWGEVQQWERQSGLHSQWAQAHDAFWSGVVDMLVTADDQGTHRAAFRAALGRLNASLDGVASVHVLFEGESMEEYAARVQEGVQPHVLSVEGQYAAMQRVMLTGEMFESTPSATAQPVTLAGDDKTKAAVLLVVDSDAEFEAHHAQTHTLPLVTKALQLVIHAEATTREMVKKQTECQELHRLIDQQRGAQRQSMAILRLSESLAHATSLEQVVDTVNKHTASVGDLDGMTLFVAETEDPETTECSAAPSLRCVWTVAQDAAKPERVVLYDRQSVMSPRKGVQHRGGMAAFVLDAGAPLSYTPHHDAYDTALRRKVTNRPESPDQQLWYYAVPLHCERQARRIHGVFEVSFASEEHRDAFVDSAFARELTETLSSFFQLHVWLSQREESHMRSALEVHSKNTEIWTRWARFVADWCEHSQRSVDLEVWKASTTSAIQSLIPAATFVNVLFSDNEEEAALIDRVERELGESDGVSSPSLNVLNHDILRSVAVFPLARERGIGDKDEPAGEGLLVLAATGNSAFDDEDRRFGTMVARLLVVWWRGHRASREADAQNAILRGLLEALEIELAGERKSRRFLKRGLFQLRLVSCLSRLSDAATIEPVEETMQKALRAVIDECAKQSVELSEGLTAPQKLFWVAALESFESEEGVKWRLWNGGEDSAVAVASAAGGEIEAMLRTSRVCEYTPPFPDQAMAVIQTVVGSAHEFVVQGSRLFLAPLATVGDNNSTQRRVLVVLTGSSDDEDGDCGRVVDEAFVQELVRGFDRVLSAHASCQLLHLTKAELSDRTTECEQLRISIDKASAAHSAWSACWRRVISDVITLSPQCDNEAAIAAIEKTFLEEVESSTLQELSAYLEDADCPGAVDVKIVVHTQNQDAIREWLRTHERLQLVDLQSYVEEDDPGQWTCRGGAASGIFVATLKREDSASDGEGITCAVRCGSKPVESDAAAVDAVLLRVVKQHVVLVAFVRSILDLHRHRCRGNALVSSQNELLEEKSATIDGLQASLDSRQLVDCAVQKLLEALPQREEGPPGGSLTASLCRVMEEIPDYQLWIRDTKSDTLWTTLSDGSKRVRSVDASTWATHPHTATINVDGEHVALVEFTGDSSIAGADQSPPSSLALVTSALLGCFNYSHSLTVIQQQQLTIEAIHREQEERRRSEAVQSESVERHSHYVDELLRSRVRAEEEIATDWNDVLHEIEADMTSTVSEIEAVRVAIVAFDVVRRQVTDKRGSTSSLSGQEVSQAYQSVASALGIWSQDAEAESIVRELQGDDMKQVSPHLFPKEISSETHCIVAVAIPTDHVSSGVSGNTHRSYVIATALVRLRAPGVSVSQTISRVLETDTRLVATAVVSWQRHEISRLRAAEAEQARATTAEELATAQQWTEFTQRAMEASQLLMEATATAITTAAPDDNPALKTRVQQFVLSVCGCDALELFAATDNSTDRDPRQRHLTPVVSSLSRPTESLQTLEKLLHQDTSEPTTVVRSSPDSSAYRVISLLRHDEHVVGVVVLHWPSQSLPLSSATLELVDSMVAPWLTVLVQLIEFGEAQRAAREADSTSIASLSEHKAALELEGLRLKNHLTQIEQRNATLTDTCQLMGDVFGSTEKTVAALIAVTQADDAWEILVKGLAGLHGVEGVQLYEKLEANTSARLVVSTLSTADDEILERAIGDSAGRSGVVATCFKSAAPQETRVAFQSQFKRVRCVSVGQDHHRCLLVVYEAHNSARQVSTMTDLCVDLAVRLAASRVTELGRIQLQAIAAGALEETTQDLTTQLQLVTEELTQERKKNDVAMALHHSLTEDLVGNEVWKSVERPPPATSFPTAKLVVQWCFLQEAAQRRLRKALSEDATVQLYGVVSAASDDSFVFSLPSQTSTIDQPGSHKKGFFCVAMRHLQQQKREWRVMAKCIAKRTRTSVDAKAKSEPRAESKRPSRKVFFPVLKQSRPDNNEADEDESNNGDADGTSDRGDASAAVVGVLAVKSRDLEKVSDEVEALLQAFADALAPRVEWIARLVDQKQQHRKPASRVPAASQPRLLTKGADLRSDTEASEYRDISAIGGSTRETGEAAVSSRWPGNEHGDATEDLRYTAQAPVSSALATNPAFKMRAPSQDRSSNQFEAAQHEDVDSEDERQAERVRQRVHAAVASALLSFSFRVQSLAVDAEGVAALRSLVMREIKNVWTSSGDDRKKALDSVELFFVLDGVVSDRLDGERSASVPAWLQESTAKWAVQDSFRMWKADARRWVASMSNAKQCKAQLLLAITGSADLNLMFDAADERQHLPSLLRVLHFHVVRVLASQAQADSTARQKELQDEKLSRELAAVEDREEEFKRRAKREEELNSLITRLLQAPDERAVIQTGLQAMKQWLQCAQVAFHAASSSSAQHPHAVDGDAGGSSYGVAMETVLRVRVLTGDHGDRAESGRRLLGTMVARLSDTERQALENSQYADRKEWLLRLLHRLADAVGGAWGNLQQRQQLEESARHLVIASNEIETLQQQLEDLQDANGRLTERVDELERDVEEKDAVAVRQDQLQRELEELRSALEASEEDRRGMAAQLKRYETQLVEVNSQLEQSIRVETQLMQLEQVHAATQAHEAQLERKLLKQKLQLKQLVAELASRRDKDERDQAELVELRRQVAVLMEKQQHSGRLDATSVTTAVMQAQAQAHQSQAETKQEQQQRVQSAVQRRLLRQLQLQQQTQKQKQLDLAQELKQLAALEVREMQRRSVEQRERDVAEQWQRIRSQSPTKASDGLAKVHNARAQAAVAVATSKTTSAAVGSKLRPPTVVVAARRQETPRATD